MGLLGPRGMLSVEQQDTRALRSKDTKKQTQAKCVDDSKSGTTRGSSGGETNSE